MSAALRQPPRILILAPFFPPFRGAVASRLSSLANHWSKWCEVLVVTPYSGDGSNTYRKILFPLTRYPLEFFCLPFRLPGLIKEVRGLKPGIILASIPPVWPLMEGYVLSKILGIPLILDIRDLPASSYDRNVKGLFRKVFNLAMRKISHFLIPRVSTVVAVTQWSSNKIAELYGFPSGKVHVIRNGSERIFFKKALSVKKTFDIVYSGTIIKVRNPAGMLSFLLALLGLYPTLKVLFISPMDSRTSLDFFLAVKNSELNHHVTFMAPRSNHKLARLLAMARMGFNALCTSNPAFRGAVGAKEYEYLAAGLPIMALLNPYFFVEEGRLIRDNAVGYVYPDPMILAKKSAELLRSPSDLKKMSSRAFETGAMFDRGRLARDYYKKVILPVYRGSLSEN